jgi:hypothetical protein
MFNLQISWMTGTTLPLVSLFGFSEHLGGSEQAWPPLLCDIANLCFLLSISPLDKQLYIQPMMGAGLNYECYRFGVSPSTNALVIGATVMEGFYVVFDRAHKRVGFAASPCAGESFSGGTGCLWHVLTWNNAGWLVNRQGIVSLPVIRDWILCIKWVLGLLRRWDELIRVKLVVRHSARGKCWMKC